MFDQKIYAATGLGLYVLDKKYMQEGFQRAILATYINTDGKTINLEIFEMIRFAPCLLVLLSCNAFAHPGHGLVDTGL